MKKVSNTLSRIINSLLFVFITVLVSITFLQVLSRFVFKIPIVWTEEVVRMCFVWIIFLGGAIGVKEGTHLTLDMLVSSLNQKWQFIMRILVLFLILITVFVMFYAGYNYVLRNVGKTAVTMSIPSNTVYISAPVSALLMMFFTIEQFINEIKNSKKGE